MPDQVYPPDCLMKVFGYLFPTVDFDSVSFYDGIPFPLNSGQGGITIGSEGLSSDIKVYMECHFQTAHWRSTGSGSGLAVGSP